MASSTCRRVVLFLAGLIALAAAAPVAAPDERLTSASLAFASSTLQQRVAGLPAKAQKELRRTLAKTHLKLGDNLDISDEGVVRISDDFEVDPTAMRGEEDPTASGHRARRSLPSDQQPLGFSDTGKAGEP
jgi:hypothetical protein